MRVLEDRDDAVVRQLVGRVDQALYGLRIDAVLHVGRVRAARRVAHVERDRRSVGREARLEADRGLGAIATLADFTIASEGAKFGYTLLSVVLLSNLMAMLLQALSAKLGIVTGRDLAQACQ